MYESLYSTVLGKEWAFEEKILILRVMKLISREL